MKNYEKYESTYDFTDSIIDSIIFDNPIMDMRMSIDYFWSEDKKHTVIELVFKKCLDVKYCIPDELYVGNEDKLNFSHFTIVTTKLENDQGNLCMKFYTYSYQEAFLSVTAKKIYVSK